MDITERLEEYRIVQEGQVVAGVAGRRAWQEIMRYAAHYSKDGRLQVQELANKRWRTVMWVNEAEELDKPAR